MKIEPFTFEEGNIQDVREQDTEMNISTYSSAHIKEFLSKRIGLVGKVARMSWETYTTFQSEGMMRRDHVKI